MNKCAKLLQEKGLWERLNERGSAWMTIAFILKSMLICVVIV